MRALARAAELDELDREMTPGETVEAIEGMQAMIAILKEQVTDWDFVDEEGEQIPYTPAEWDERLDQLVAASFAALQTTAGSTRSRPTAAPSGSAGIRSASTSLATGGRPAASDAAAVVPKAGVLEQASCCADPAASRRSSSDARGAVVNRVSTSDVIPWLPA
jgi:hypothetical protein